MLKNPLKILRKLIALFWFAGVFWLSHFNQSLLLIGMFLFLTQTLIWLYLVRALNVSFFERLRVWLMVFLMSVAIVFIPRPEFRDFLSVVFAVILYTSLSESNFSSEPKVLSQSILGIFGLNFALVGMVSFFPVPSTVFLPIYFVLLALFVRTTVEKALMSSRVRPLASVSLAAFGTEISWVVGFLPFHFSILAVLVSLWIATLWILYYHYLYNNLNIDKVRYYCGLAAVLSILLIVSTPWRILN